MKKFFEPGICSRTIWNPQRIKGFHSLPVMIVREQGGKLIRSVYRDPRFDRQLETIRKASKKGLIAANEADAIINRMIQGCDSPAGIGAMTKNGEHRIKKCTKYDLGCGYRLISVLDKDCLFVTYVGTHDECDLWLEKNKYLQPRVIFPSNSRKMKRKMSHSFDPLPRDFFGKFSMDCVVGELTDKSGYQRKCRLLLFERYVVC